MLLEWFDIVYSIGSSHRPCYKDRRRKFYTYVLNYVTCNYIYMCVCVDCTNVFMYLNVVAYSESCSLVGIPSKERQKKKLKGQVQQNIRVAERLFSTVNLWWLKLLGLQLALGQMMKIFSRSLNSWEMNNNPFLGYCIAFITGFKCDD